MLGMLVFAGERFDRSETVLYVEVRAVWPSASAPR